MDDVQPEGDETTPFLAQTTEALVYVAIILLLLRRLAKGVS